MFFFVSAKLEGEQFFAEVPGLCEVIAKLCTVSCVTSLLTIATMSLNRYMFVCHNILYKKIFSRRNSIIICIGVYCVGIAFVAMNFAGIGDHSFDKKSLECIWDRMADHPYTVVYSVTLVWIPCIVIGICYLRLYCFVSENKKKLLHHKIRSLAGSPASLVPQTSNLKLAKTFILIYVVFVTCWAPYALLIVIDYRDAMTHEIHVYITVWAHLHPSINWLIYYLTQRKLAEAYRQILVCTISIMKTSRLDTDSSNEVCHQPNIVLRKSGVKIDPVCDSGYSKIPVGSLECLEKERENNKSLNFKGKFRSSFSDGDIEKYIRISIREKTSQSTLDVHDRATMTEDTTTNSQEVKILMEIYKTIRGIQSVVTSHTLHTKHHVNAKLVGTDLGESSSIALL